MRSQIFAAASVSIVALLASYSVANGAPGFVRGVYQGGPLPGLFSGGVIYDVQGTTTVTVYNTPRSHFAPSHLVIYSSINVTACYNAIYVLPGYLNGAFTLTYSSKNLAPPVVETSQTWKDIWTGKPSNCSGGQQTPGLSARPLEWTQQSPTTIVAYDPVDGGSRTFTKVP